MTRPGGRRGWLVAIEGIDGAGKSSLQRRLARRWRARGLRVTVRREPTDRAVGRRAVEVTARDPGLAAILFTLDRARHRADLERALRGADVVLLDRSFYSTLAYQGSALDRAGRRSLLALQRAVAVAPDRVLWLDLTPAEAMARVGRRGGATAPTERQATLRRVARAYRGMARDRRWQRLDASLPLPDVVQAADAGLRAAGLYRRRPRTTAG